MNTVYLQPGFARSEKITDVQFLRAVAIFFVFNFHLKFFQFTPFAYLHFAWTGVDLFFVISGFLITRSLQNSSSSSPRLQVLRDFYIRRVRRIMPLALLCLLIWWIFGYTTPSKMIGESLAILLFYSNYIVAHTTDFQLGFFWSLSLEEQFYFLFPFFYLFVRSVAKRIGTLIALVVMIAGFLRPFNMEEPWRLILFSTHFRVDTIILGVLAAEIFSLYSDKILSFRSCIQQRKWLRFGLRILLFMLLLFVGSAPSLWSDNMPHLIAFGLSLVALASVLVVMIAALDLKLTSVSYEPFDKVISWVASRSYGLYLFHLPVHWLLVDWRPGLDSGPSYIGIYFVCLGIFVELAHRFIEKPILGKALT